MKRTMQLLISALALCVLVCAAGAQQAPPPKTEPAKPKAKRVWTNDDVTNLRQPSDVYAEEKRQQAEDAAKAKEKAAAGGAAAQQPASREDKILPKTLEEAEKRVAGKLYEIEQEQEYIDRLRGESADATTDEARAAHQKRLDAALALLEESRAELKKIDARLQEFRANPPAPAPAAAPADASSPEGQLEKQIAEKREKIQSYTEYIEQLREAVAKTDSPAARDSLQKKLDGFIALQEKTSAELKTLESQQQELKSKPPAPAPPKP
jgi:predicted translin family RNA/ssDNA-binding protein